MRKNTWSRSPLPCPGARINLWGNTRIPKHRVQLRDISSLRIYQIFLLTRERNQDRQNKKFMIYWLHSGVVGPGRDWGIFSNPARQLHPFGNSTFSSSMSKCSNNHYLFSSLNFFCCCSLTWLGTYSNHVQLSHPCDLSNSTFLN